MFNFLKERIKSWLGKSKKEIEKKAVKKEAGPEKKKLEKKEKVLRKKRTKEELVQERKISATVIEDIKREDLEIKTPEERIEAQEKEKEQKEKSKEEAQKPGFFAKLKKIFTYTVTEEAFNELFSELEMLLLENNVALEVVEELKKKLKNELIGKEIKKKNLESEILKALKNSINSVLIEPEDTIKKIKEFRKKSDEPFKILFFGINGTGKTTNIAKFAALCQKNKLSVVLAAADTFRAASIEQIQIHADKIGVKLIKHDYNADPSAVAFDAIKYAKTNRIDVVLIDTAGRMHTKENLLKEMEKICRVANPNLKVFVAEAVAGNDAIEQAKAFNESIGIDGSILSKSDVDEKGGTILSIGFVTNKPILYLGTGQNYEDLELFEKENLAKRLGL